MTELEDWKRAVYEPEKAEFEATIRLLRGRIAELEPAARIGASVMPRPISEIPLDKNRYLVWFEHIHSPTKALWVDLTWRPESEAWNAHGNGPYAAYLKPVAALPLSALPQPTKEPT